MEGTVKTYAEGNRREGKDQGLEKKRERELNKKTKREAKFPRTHFIAGVHDPTRAYISFVPLIALSNYSIAPKREIHYSEFIVFR